ncbi:hypothetical protein TorRG33x02_226540 [Trema orientale]|uniref:Uncharacterized protein n=1 Tax=Trema orientale TaxID=63057 RepID=A0A2P5E7K3_TREOI|nr:hypothetical protein TorRG33x02_226540 [Trema orientale]
MQFLFELHHTATAAHLGPHTGLHRRSAEDEANADSPASFRRRTKSQRPRRDFTSGEIFWQPARRPTSIFDTSGKWSLISSSPTVDLLRSQSYTHVVTLTNI